MTKSDYTYTIEDGFLKIVDLDMGGMSVTNDIENVITEIGLSEDILNLRIIYQDSMGEWDEVIPKWRGKICTYVSYEPITKRLD